jgi:hypothetical protein
MPRHNGPKEVAAVIMRYQSVKICFPDGFIVRERVK